jgi:Protein of unknown function (DUF2510)
VKERPRPAPLDLDRAEALHRQGQRRAGAGILLGVAALCTLIAVVLFVEQTQQIGVWARVTSKRCHTSDSGGGGAAWVSFKDATCVVRLSYRAPSGKTGTVTFHGVDDFRIHPDKSGHEVVKIYFSSGSDTAVNPQDRPPWWALLIIIGGALGICGASAWGLLVGTPRAKVINRRAGEERARLKLRAEEEHRARAAAASNYVGQPAQWATDPTGRHEYRYWNGSGWTEHVANDGVQDVDPSVRL